MAEDGRLKRLAFVHDYSHKLASGAAYIEDAYKTVKPLVPQKVQPFVSKVEDAVLAYAAPVIAKTSDQAEKMLRDSDEKFDALYIATGKLLNETRELALTNIATFRDGAEKYYLLVKSTADYLTAKLKGDTSVQSAREVFTQSLEKAKELTDPDAAILAAYKAWTVFAAIPSVAKTLEAAGPVTQKGYETLVAAHDVLVSSDLYKKGLTLGANTLSWATTTTPYKLGAQYLYPLVQPMADTALEKVAKSTYINATLKYWAPVTVAAPLAA